MNKNFKIEKEEIFKKINNENFKKLVIIGKNGVGKTELIEEIHKSFDKDRCRSFYIRADLDMSRETVNKKDSNLQKLSMLLNELTNFTFKIQKDLLNNKLSTESEFIEYINNSQNKLTEVQKWINDWQNNWQQDLNQNDKDLLNIKVNAPQINNSEYFEINYHSKISMGSFFNKIADGGAGQQFYTMLVAINKVLDFQKNLLPKNYFLIIDEPENLCHPELIIKIAKVLKQISHKIKVICVTHSNLFISHFVDYLDEILLISKINDFFIFNNQIFEKKIKLMLEKFIELSENQNINEILKNSLKNLCLIYNQGINKWFHFWSVKKDILEAMFYQNIIICEGINDHHFLSSIDFKYENFILKSHGKFEIIFMKIFLELYNKKVFIVCDQDIGGDKPNPFWKDFNSLIIKANNSSKAHFHFIKPDFEKYFGIDKKIKSYIPRLYYQGNPDSTFDLEKSANLTKELQNKINGFFEE